MVSGELSVKSFFSPLTTRHSVDSVRCWTAHSKYANTGNPRFQLRCGLIDKNPALTDMAGVLCEDKAFEFFRERERERERSLARRK